MTTATRPRVRLLDLFLAPLRLLERVRGWRRRLLILVYIIIGSIIAFLVWWATSLNNLPDVGDPFDVEKFIGSSKLADSPNAFAKYHEARRLYVGASITNDNGTMWNSLRLGWAKADPQIHKWVEANRKALDCWRDGTNRPEGVAEDLETVVSAFDTHESDVMLLTYAAIFEGARLEAEGDLSGALDWYLAVIRSGRHYSTKSRMSWRNIASYMDIALRDRVVAWANDSRITPALLRRAIGEYQKIDAKTPPISDNLKAEYVAVMHALDDLPQTARRLDSSSGTTYRYEEMPKTLHFYWFVRREPERSRRVARLIFSNWLAHCDDPQSSRPKTVNLAQYSPWALYEPAAGDPPAANALDAAKLLGYLEWTAVLWRFFPSYPQYAPQVSTERQGRATMMVYLAEKLYKAETGDDPPSVNALVPKYLSAVPAEYVEPKSQAPAGKTLNK